MWLNSYRKVDYINSRPAQTIETIRPPTCVQLVRLDIRWIYALYRTTSQTSFQSRNRKKKKKKGGGGEKRRSFAAEKAHSGDGFRKESHNRESSTVTYFKIQRRKKGKPALVPSVSVFPPNLYPGFVYSAPVCSSSQSLFLLCPDSFTFHQPRAR